MSIFRNRKKTAYRIAACIIAAMITISPAAAGMQVYAEERAEEEKEQKKYLPDRFWQMPVKRTCPDLKSQELTIRLKLSYGANS